MNGYQKNISDVITDIRIEAACNLLKNTNLSLKEISFKVGYSNQYYLVPALKRRRAKRRLLIDRLILFILGFSSPRIPYS